MIQEKKNKKQQLVNEKKSVDGYSEILHGKDWHARCRWVCILD